MKETATQKAERLALELREAQEQARVEVHKQKFAALEKALMKTQMISAELNNNAMPDRRVCFWADNHDGECVFGTRTCMDASDLRLTISPKLTPTDACTWLEEILLKIKTDGEKLFADAREQEAKWGEVLRDKDDVPF